jgi:hypothetical protein
VTDLLQTDPIPLAFEFADAELADTSYRRRVKARLASLFLVMGVARLADIRSGMIVPFLEKEVKLERMTASTANAYRIAAWGFIRWLVNERKIRALSRVVAELDVQGVKQCSTIRGGRQTSRKVGAK